MYRNLGTITLMTFLCVLAKSQQVLYPGQSGEELKAQIIEDFKPDFVELYTDAREIMYRDLYNVNDTVYTIYVNHRLYLPPDEERPIGFLAMNADNNGISAEHIYPRSKGASEENGNAFSDLHNLAPTRWEVNEVRSNFPFKDIPDAETDFWFYRDFR